MASKRRQMYVFVVGRGKPPPPPWMNIPGVEQARRKRIQRDIYLSEHPINEGASRPVGPASPRQVAPRNRRYSRRAPGDRFTGTGRRRNQFN